MIWVSEEKNHFVLAKGGNLWYFIPRFPTERKARAGSHAMLFTGHYRRTIDAKNRIQVPAPLRAEMGGEGETVVLYVVPGERANTLSIFTRESFLAQVERISSGSIDSPDVLDFELYYALAERVELDKQGRMVLPETSLSRVQLSKDIVLAGQHTRIDIWQAEQFDECIRTRFESRWPALQRFVRGGGRPADAGQTDEH